MKYLIVDDNGLQTGTLKKDGFVKNLLYRFRHGKRIWKWIKERKLYQKWRICQSYRHAVCSSREAAFGNTEFICMSLPLRPKELAQLSEEQIGRLLIKPFEKSEKEIRLFAVQRELLAYIPPQMSWCENSKEVYIMIAQHLVPILCGKYSLSRKTARLLFLDDGSCEADAFIRPLSQYWNYVTVCSNRQEALEELYQQLYEEEGLMVESRELDRRTACQGDLVIDLTGDWQGLHRMYPAHALVMDLTFSREKEQYLCAKQARPRVYIQLADLDRITSL